ncbi:hypothetical protein MTR_1g046940 [Medicago truncatula]|uniref:Uncharacterized protein n=1 Tax=Medicago truncatula TaxID=3880 RepID=A0A072VHZ1_MEDTR|nr:hypothetical protein MTR_1g046940 [Medicago truncatula]
MAKFEILHGFYCERDGFGQLHMQQKGLNVLMKSLVQAQLFTGYSFWVVNPVVVSHLQFADDTLLLGTKNWANVRALRAALFIFKVMSRLKVNFHKSSLVGVNIASSWLSEAASVLNCKVGKVPFLYLGFPIGGNSRRLSFWEPFVNRIKARLSGWNSRFLSFGGRLWLGSVSLCERFPRLFDLSENKSITVADLFSLGVERGGEAWKWRRRLWAWEEEELEECRALLTDVSLQDFVSDRWVWLPNPFVGYSVRGSYHMLTSRDVPLRDPASSLMVEVKLLEIFFSLFGSCAFGFYGTNSSSFSTPCARRVACGD